MPNMILATDSYKITHHNMYRPGTTGVYSYLEARQGAKFPETVFFGLQPLLQEMAESRVTYNDLTEARELAHAHFGNNSLFNYRGWVHIIEEHQGRLPVRVKAVPEGTVVPIDNVLMTVENTDPACAWLTNALESYLLHVWYPTTVATVSYGVKKTLREYLRATSDNEDAALPFMLHDFGYRGATGDQAAAIGGAAHLVNFMGTDTLPAMLFAKKHYSADYADLAFSVPATEHSVMTADGPAGEMQIVADLLDQYPAGILSVVADSYDIYGFVDAVGTTFKDRIRARDGKFVVRPDSVTERHPTPEMLVLNLLDRLWATFGGAVNTKGFRVLDPHIGLLWGDGIDPDGIGRILAGMRHMGWSAENIVFGMGGGLLQKVNRDTQRFAFKCSAQQRDGRWIDVQKNPLDASKKSKAGRLALVQKMGGMVTLEEGTSVDLLETVFENGKVVSTQNFADIRAHAAL